MYPSIDSGLIRDIWKLMQSKWVHVTVFFIINVVMGSLGVWLPIALAAINPGASTHEELVKVFRASGPYTFAVAYLTAAAAYIALEYLEGVETQFRGLKTFLGLMAFLAIVLCSLLAAAQPSAPLLDRTTNTMVQSYVSKFGVGDVVQATLTVISLLLGFLLFLLDRAEDDDQIEALTAIRDKTTSRKREAQDLMDTAKSVKSDDLQI